MTTGTTCQTLLQLPEPWLIAWTDTDAEGEAVCVCINFRLGAPLCPQHSAACEVYDRGDERVWRHLDLWRCKTWSLSKLFCM